MVDTLAIFRGCSRLEYRNQNIKLLRAAEGEYTRSSYRLLWVADDVRDALRREPNAIATAVLVDENNALAFPVRQMMVVDHRVDEEHGFLHLTFEIGEFVETLLDFSPQLSSWVDGAGACPPNVFVSKWRDDWPAVEPLSTEASWSRWREAVDFLTSSWGGAFDSSAFFRVDAPLEGTETAPRLTVTESQQAEIRVRSYNPHLQRNVREAHVLRVGQSGGLIAVEDGDRAAIPRDGDVTVRVRCLEAGQSSLTINVEPDPQFSTYVPLLLDVQPDPELTTGKPQLLGREWQQCLDGLRTHLTDNPALHLTVLDLLGRVFPDDPTVLQHKGRVQYQQGRLAEARELLDAALSIREDALTVAWNLFAALRRGDVADALNLLTRLNLSRYELFDELIDVVHELPEPVALAVASVAGDVFGDDKALRLLEAIADHVVTETGVVRLATEIARVDPSRALVYLMASVNDSSDWRDAITLVVELANTVGRTEGVEGCAVQALQWRGETAAVFSPRWHQFRRLITNPETRVHLLAYNVRRLFDAGLPLRELAAPLALEAADGALNQGELMLAEEMLTLLYANLTADEPAQQYWLAEAAVSAVRLGELRSVLTPVQRGSEEYTRRLYSSLRPWTTGRTIALLGLAVRPTRIEEWESELRARIVWLPSTVANPVNEQALRELNPSDLIIVEFWEHMSHLKPNTKRWIKENDVPHVPTRGTGGLMLEALHRFFPTLEDQREPSP